MSSGRCSAVQTAPITLRCSTPIVTGKSMTDELPSSTGCLRMAPLKGLSRMRGNSHLRLCVQQRLARSAGIDPPR
jgi:hypothetical protein